MLNLVFKDFLLQKKILIFAIGYAVFLFFAFIPPGLNKMVYSVGAIAISYISFMAVISSEDKNNSDIILNSLPIKRAQIVLAKYLALIMLIFISFIIMGATGAVLKIIGFPPVQRFVTIYDLSTIFIVVGLLSSLYYPLYLKFGQKYMRIFNILFFLLAFSIPGAITKIVLVDKKYGVLRELVEAIKASANGFMLGAILLTVIVLLISMALSMKIYKNRDL